MFKCFFATDLHGKTDRYEKLVQKIREDKPRAVFLGGDLLPFTPKLILEGGEPDHFLIDTVAPMFEDLQSETGSDYPRVFSIMGNDDAKIFEKSFLELEKRNIWEYSQEKIIELEKFKVFGYAYVPPTPFHLKDWEKYDVSRYVDPGCIHPVDGKHSVNVEKRKRKYETIKDDLDSLEKDDFSNWIMLFHSPPYDSLLDRADLDGKTIDHAPLDNHVGSIAIQRFIQTRQPGITLHGHIHESTKLTGQWKQQFWNTWSFQGAHYGIELSIVIFDAENPENSKRVLI